MSIIDRLKIACADIDANITFLSDARFHILETMRYLEKRESVIPTEPKAEVENPITDDDPDAFVTGAWSEDEHSKAKEMIANGMSSTVIAATLNRPLPATRSKRTKLNKDALTEVEPKITPESRGYAVVSGPWQDEECLKAIIMLEQGKSTRKIATALNRPFEATKFKLRSIRKEMAGDAAHGAGQHQPPHEWTNEQDLILISGLSTGKGLQRVSESLGKTLDTCRLRFKTMINGVPTPAKQKKVADELRFLIAKEKNLVDAG